MFYSILFEMGAVYAKSRLFADEDMRDAWSAFYERARQAVSCRFFIVNCAQNGDLFMRLNALAAENPNVCFSIRHILVMQSEKTAAARGILEILPMLFHRSYDCVAFNEEEARDLPLLKTDTAFVTLTDARGEKRGYQILWLKTRRGVMIETEAAAAGKIERAMQLPAAVPSCDPLQSESRDVSFDGYMKIIGEYERAENGRDVYSIHYDLCISFIDANILKSAFIDGIKWLNLPIPGLSAGIKELYQIQAARFHNAFHGQKLNCLIISEKGFRQFVKTGKLDNEVQLLRPFTVAERVAILDHLCRQAAENPNFQLFFMKENAAPEMRVSITYYDGFGMAFVCRGKPYFLTGTDGDGFIQKISFGDLFRRFVREQLVNNKALVLPDSVDFLKKQIEQLQATQMKKP